MQYISRAILLVNEIDKLRGDLSQAAGTASESGRAHMADLDETLSRLSEQLLNTIARINVARMAEREEAQ